MKECNGGQGDLGVAPNVPLGVVEPNPLKGFSSWEFIQNIVNNLNKNKKAKNVKTKDSRELGI